MIRRTVSVVTAFAALLLVLGSQAPSQAITLGYVNGTGGLWDANGTMTNISVSAYQNAAGFTGSFTWTTFGVMSVSGKASSLSFDSPTQVTMRGTLTYGGQPCNFELKVVKPGILSLRGNICLQVVSSTGSPIYPISGTYNGAALPLYSSNLAWMYFP